MYFKIFYILVLSDNPNPIPNPNPTKRINEIANIRKVLTERITSL